MDLWQDLEARYCGQIPMLTEREAEARLRRTLQQEYLAWSRVVVVRALDSLARALEARVRELPWLSTLPLSVSAPAPHFLCGEGVCALSVRLWGTSVEAYIRSGPDAPPSLHFLRQWGGHRAPRMACVPGAWLRREGTEGYSFHRFGEAGTLLKLDDLTAMVVALLLGRAGHH